MTRINCIPIDELTRQHCFAEYRELPRIRHAWPRREHPNIPKHYCLGKGHCTFFYDKGLWLLKRHKALYAYLVEYWGYNIQKIPIIDLTHWPQCAMNNWIPDNNAMRLNRERIHERLLK